MAIETKFDFQEIYKDIAETVSLVVTESGAAASISSASYNVISYSDVTMLSGSCSISENRISFLIPTDTFSDYCENNRIEWLITTSSGQYRSANLFDVVRYKLINSVVDNDLLDVSPYLSRNALKQGETNFQKQIEVAFKDVCRKIKQTGKRPSLIIDSEQIKKLIVLKAISLIYLDLSSKSDDIWSEKYKRFDELFNSEWSSTVLKYDEDQSGTIDFETNVQEIRWRL